MRPLLERWGRALSTLEALSFDFIHARYFDFVWSSVRGLGVNQASLEDVVQETFMAIHGSLHTLRQPESLRSWIYGVVRRTVQNFNRSRRLRNALDLALATQTKLQEETQPTPYELTEQSEGARLLWQLFSEIDQPKRDVLVLAELEDMSAPEISDALAIPLNTVYSRLRRARDGLAAALRRRAARRESRWCEG